MSVLTEGTNRRDGSKIVLPAVAVNGGVCWPYPRRVADAMSTENVIDRLLLALAAQLATAEDPALAAGAVEELAELGRTEADVIFGRAGHLVHYGAAMEPLEALIRMIAAIQRGEAPSNAAVRAGDEVRLVGDLPESVARYGEAFLGETIFVVRYVGRDGTVDVQPELNADYVIETVPLVNVRPAWT